MPPKLRVLAHNARLEKRMQNEISNSLASVLKTDPKMDLKDAMWSVTNEMLTNNPFQPPKDGKCPINDLPDEILGYIFSVGVKQEVEEDLEGYDSEDDADWEDVDEEDEEEEENSSGDEKEDEETSVPIVNGGRAPFDSDSDGSSDSDMYDDEVQIPFQVLVSHICKRWRAVALDSHILWTTLNFEKRPNLEKAKTYISRAQGLPLRISIDCTFPEDVDEEDHPDHPLYSDNKDLRKARRKEHSCGDPHCEGGKEDEMSLDDDVEEEEIHFLSQKELSSILDLIEPEVSHWGSFDFRASTYGYVQLLLSRLAKLPSAPLLEAFEVYHFEDCDDYEFFNGDDKTAFLPFHGNAPLLKDAVFWGVHIDWDAATTSFLTGLRELDFSFHAKDVRPSYESFSKFITSSPDLHTLNLTLSGPVLSDGVEFDAEREEGGWGSNPLSIPSLREFSIQFHDPKYASALVQHLDMPNLTGLLLNFDEQDYTSFVRTLLKPVKGRTESLLQHVDHLKVSGLPCDVATAYAFLDQLGNLRSFNLKVGGVEEAIIFQKLIDPSAISAPFDRDAAPEDVGPIATAQAASSSITSEAESGTASPALFCPKLETLTTNAVDGFRLKQLVEVRKKLGAPLKRVFMSYNDHVSEKEEKWLRANLDELEFFEPSDSEEEVEEFVYGEENADESGDWQTDSGHEDADAGEDEVEDGDEPPLMSPLARHLGRRRRRAMDLD